MKKSDLIPLKHLLITRNREVYWYIGNDIKNNVIACGAEIDRNLNKTWDENLFARRDGSLSSWEEPRDYDIIYVYQIIDANEWFDVYHKNPYIKFEEHIRNDYSFYPFVKQIYERIDGGLGKLILIYRNIFILEYVPIFL